MISKNGVPAFDSAVRRDILIALIKMAESASVKVEKKVVEEKSEEKSPELAGLEYVARLAEEQMKDPVFREARDAIITEFVRQVEKVHDFRCRLPYETFTDSELGWLVRKLEKLRAMGLIMRTDFNISLVPKAEVWKLNWNARGNIKDIQTQQVTTRHLTQMLRKVVEKIHVLLKERQEEPNKMSKAKLTKKEKEALSILEAADFADVIPVKKKNKSSYAKHRPMEGKIPYADRNVQNQIEGVEDGSNAPQNQLAPRDEQAFVQQTRFLDSNQQGPYFGKNGFFDSKVGGPKAGPSKGGQKAIPAKPLAIKGLGPFKTVVGGSTTATINQPRDVQQHSNSTNFYDSFRIPV